VSLNNPSAITFTFDTESSKYYEAPPSIDVETIDNTPFATNPKGEISDISGNEGKLTVNLKCD